MAYMLSGNLAMNDYTVPRMTQDLDIVVNLQMEDRERFAAIFRKGFYFHEEGLIEEIERRGMFNIIDYQTGYKVDFIIHKNSEFHINEFERRRPASIYGFNCCMVSLEDLIIAKLIWIQEIRSDVQINDLQNILENADVDFDYLKRWISQLKLETFNLIKNA